ncbi:hypothetical protein [Streptomyces sp. NBC_00986]|uniref:hypothetical protein n=1 Tax=Streptomyces sp. NBC_00986 TaxID=2903702 RepID=UPI00386EA2D3|nr:hypothetical protein OG504_51560 [Streptomyces sp. NBC_00986]
MKKVAQTRRTGADAQWPLDDGWDRHRHCAQAHVATLRGTDSWVPPVEEEPVPAAPEAVAAVGALVEDLTTDT